MLSWQHWANVWATPFLARVLDETGAKQRYCRLFVAGVPTEDLRTPIDTDSIEIEMILLVAIEGG